MLRISPGRKVCTISTTSFCSTSASARIFPSDTCTGSATPIPVILHTDKVLSSEHHSVRSSSGFSTSDYGCLIGYTSNPSIAPSELPTLASTAYVSLLLSIRNCSTVIVCIVTTIQKYHCTIPIRPSATSHNRGSIPYMIRAHSDLGQGCIASMYTNKKTKPN